MLFRSKRAFIIADMPWGTYQTSPAQAFANAAELMAAGAQMVKLEGGECMAETIHFLTARGIPVCGHLGLTPQSVHALGGYRVQGKTLAATQRVLDDALALRDAGAFAILFEALPPESAAYIRERLDLICYGIGAGPHLDGQLVISHDILGNFVGDIAPKFVSRYANIDQIVEAAFRTYANEVRTKQFPAPKHWYAIDAAEAAALTQHPHSPHDAIARKSA